MMQCVQTSKIWVHDKKRYSKGKKGKCLLALALHSYSLYVYVICVCIALMYKCDMYMLLSHL